jgi:hypothetical protein
MHTTVRIALLGLCAIVGTACGSGYLTGPPQHFKIKDDGIVMPSVRADYTFSRNRSEDGTKTGRGGLSFEATRAEGDTGPASNYSVRSMQLQGRYRFADTPRVRGKLLFGLEYADLDAQVGSFHRSNAVAGPAIGLDFDVPIAGPLGGYARGSFSAMVRATTSIRGEVGMRATLGRGTDIFVGYRVWRFEQDEIDLRTAPDSDLEIRTEGLVIGMGFQF